MHILIIKNYRKKVVSTILLMMLWISMIGITAFVGSNPLLFKVSINKTTQFSYPVSYKIDSIYINENMDENAVKAVSLFSSPQIETLKKIEPKGLGFSFSFPSAFQVTEQSFVGNEILYHIDFSDKSKEAYGFVQVWNLKTPLKDFLISSKNTSLSNFKDFKMNELKVNNLDGYLWDYNAINDSRAVKALEAFLQKDGKMYRISYFVPEKFYNKYHEKTFMNIVNSIKVD
jgi:hypothetical protein